MVLLLFLPVILAFLGGITAFFIRQNKPRHLVVSIAVFSAAATALLLMFRRPEDIALLQLGGTLALRFGLDETGAFFIFRKEVFTEMGQRIGQKPYIFEIDQFEAVDIDTPEDFEFAKAVAAYLANK